MWYIICAAAVLLAAAAAVFFIANYMLNYCVMRKGVEKASKKVQKKNEPTPYRRQTMENAALWPQQQKTEHYITSFDGERLVGYEMRPETESKNVVLLMHGHDCLPGSLFPVGKMFLDMGFNLFMPEMRANGASGGDAFTFGAKESEDALLWLNKIIEIFGEDCRILISGNSLGGATTLLTCAKPSLPKQVKCAIEDCSFTDVKEMFVCGGLNVLPRFTHAAVIAAAGVIAKRRAGFSFADASPINAVPKIKLPVLFIHGGDDKFVPESMCEQLFTAKTGLKEKLIVQGAGHGVSYMTDPALYRSACTEFTERYMR